MHHLPTRSENMFQKIETPASDKGAIFTIIGHCKCGYELDGEHAGRIADLAFHPFFCVRCSAVKGVLGPRKSSPRCPTCLADNVLSYGEEPLAIAGRLAGISSHSVLDTQAPHFCPKCRNVSLKFELVR